MASRFPGMDPYIEDQLWPDFHAHFLSHLQEALMPTLRPGYVALLEERVYVEHAAEHRVLVPDVSLARTSAPQPQRPGAALVATPVRVPLTMPEEVRERRLEIRHRESRELVAVIEVLSPTNKRADTDGRREYLRKRDRVLRSSVHLVELDLLRGGQRVPTDAELPPAEYYAIVSRSGSRPMADVWPIGLRQALPAIPIPLRDEDADVSVDLQAVFTTVYERAGYDYALDYGLPVRPPLPAGDAEWARGLMA